MKEFSLKHHSWRQTVAKNLLVSLGLPVVLASAATANPANRVESSQLPLVNREAFQSDYQFERQLNACYRIVDYRAEDGTYVHRGPSVYSEPIAVLDYGETVSIAPGGTENWMPIIAPIRGYVWADWLLPC